MADEKISVMTAATSLTGTEAVPIVQSGGNLKAAVDLLRGVKYYASVSALQTDTATYATGTLAFIPSILGYYTVVASGGDLQNSNATPVQWQVLQATIGVANVVHFGAVADGTTDDYAAINAAALSLGTQGGTVDFPIWNTSDYFCGTEIEIYSVIHYRGRGSGNGNAVTKLTFASGVNGIIIPRFNTTGISGTLSVNKTQGGDGSIISGLYIASAGGSAQGVTMRARATLRDSQVWGFGSHNIAVTAGTDGNPVLGDANGWNVTRCTSYNAGACGLYVDGTDANAGHCTALSVGNCGTYGIYETSFLRNSYNGCQVVGCSTANYYAANFSIFEGCYSESGVGGDPSTFGAIILLGCLIGNGNNITGNAVQIGATNANILGGELTLNRPIRFTAYNDTTKSTTIADGTYPLLYTDTNHFPGGVSFGADKNASNNFVLKDGGQSSYTHWFIATGLGTSYYAGRPQAIGDCFIVPRLFIGDGQSTNPLTNDPRAFAFAAGQPTTGVWAVGDEVHAGSTYTSGGTAYWKCYKASVATTGTTDGTTAVVPVASSTNMSAGEYITIAGAGTSGADFTDTILSVDSGTQVTLNSVPPTAVTSATTTTAGLWDAK